MRQDNTTWSYLLMLTENKSALLMDVGLLYVLFLKYFAILDE